MLELFANLPQINKTLKTSMFKSFQQENNLQTESNHKSAFGFWFGILAGLIVVDQIAKYWAQKYLTTIFLNNQFAFSLPVPVPMMYVIYTLVLAGVIYYLHRNRLQLNSVERFSWSLILAGGLSNIGERLLLGHVRDFIPLLTGVFNFADIYIVFGVVLLFAAHQRKL